MEKKKTIKQKLPTDKELMLLARQLHALMLIRGHLNERFKGAYAAMPFLIFTMLVRDKDFFTIEDMMFFCGTNAAGTKQYIGELRKVNYVEGLTRGPALGRYALTYEGRELANWIYQEFAQQVQKRRRTTPRRKESTVKKTAKAAGQNVL